MLGKQYVLGTLSGCTEHLDILGLHSAIEKLTHAMHTSHECCPSASEADYAHIYSGFELLLDGYIYLIIDEPLQLIRVHICSDLQVEPQALLQLLCEYFVCENSSLRTIGAAEAT
jgi:hypothetical protein